MSFDIFTQIRESSIFKVHKLYSVAYLITKPSPLYAFAIVAGELIRHACLA